MNKMEYGYIRNTKTKHGHFFHKIITSNTQHLFLYQHTIHSQSYIVDQSEGRLWSPTSNGVKSWMPTCSGATSWEKPGFKLNARLLFHQVEILKPGRLSKAGVDLAAPSTCRRHWYRSLTDVVCDLLGRAVLHRVHQEVIPQLLSIRGVRQSLGRV